MAGSRTDGCGEGTGATTPDVASCLRACCDALQEKKGFDVTVLHLTDVSPVADHFVIASGFSRPQVQGLADGVTERLRAEGCPLLRREGYAAARWVCLDYGDVVVHIFHDDVRRYFDLERLWGDVPRDRLTAGQAVAAPA